MTDKKFRWHWGHTTFTILAVFVLLMVYTVYMTFQAQSNFVLESPNYYEEELNYDQTIEELKRGIALKATWSREGENLVVNVSGVSAAELLLKHPTSVSMDQRLTASVGDSTLFFKFDGHVPKLGMNWRAELEMKTPEGTALIKKTWMY